MKNLSHLCIAVLTTAMLLDSCKKSSIPTPSDPASSMTFTANGHNISFNDCEEAPVEVNGILQTTFLGTTVTNGNPGDARFQVCIQHDPATIKAGQTYRSATSFEQAEGVVFYYYPDASHTFVSQPANPQGSVTITNVTSTTISGIFSGHVFTPDDLTGVGVVYTIINGSFTATINK